MEPAHTPPAFPARALPSKGVFYRPLQDIDVYVEDEGSEAFYTELLKRLLPEGARIATVIPLRGRKNVVDTATSYSAERPAIFLIDGDLQWVAGLSLPSAPQLYVHPCYCVENYLFCEKAMVEIAVENSGSLSRDDAARELDWAELRTQLENHLVPLFVEFAVAFTLCPDIKTVSRGIGSILRDARRGSPPEIDFDKVNDVRNSIRSSILSRVSEDDYNHTRTTVAERVRVLSDPLDVVSGKDYLVPVQMFEASRTGGQKVQRRSFVFRLARHCHLHKLDSLRERILDILQPNKAMEATA